MSGIASQEGPGRPAALAPSSGSWRALASWWLLGALHRVLVAFPTGRFYWESDASLAGLNALRILDGEPLVFFNGFRLGAIGSYLTAALVALLGPTREALALGPLLIGCATLAVFALLARELVGAELALWAMPLAAFPPPAATIWTAMPVNYAEPALFCLLPLWWIVRMARRGATPGRWALLGLLGGLAVWTSILTLCAIVPALLWLFARRGFGILSLRAALGAGFAFAVGFAPWWLYNLVHGFPSLRSNFAAEAADPGLAPANLVFTLGHRIPELLAWTPTLRPWIGTGEIRTLLAWTVLAAWALLAALSVLRLRGIAGRASPGPPSSFDGALVAFGVLAATVAANVVSRAGSVRGESVRYVLPIALVAPLLPALARGTVPWRRWLVGGLVVLVAGFDLAGTIWPWHPERVARRADAREDAAILRRLESARVEVLAGGYSQVYAFNLWSGRRLVAVPIEPRLDYQQSAQRIPAGAARWALLGRGSQDRDRLVDCGPRVLPGGRLERLPRGRWLWIGGELDSTSRARDALQVVRSACPDLGSLPAPPRR